MARGKKHTPEQIVSLLRQIEVAVANGCRSMKRVTLVALACAVLASLFSLSCKSRKVVIAFHWNDTVPTMPWIHLPGQYYRYAPSVVQVSPTSRFVYYCANATSGQIKDDIMYRSATLANGLWSWTSGEEVALAPADPVFSLADCDDIRKSFDCYHVCDPEYVQGDTMAVFQNKTYTLAMFYTGNDYNGGYHNSVGVAFNNHD